MIHYDTFYLIIGNDIKELEINANLKYSEFNGKEFRINKINAKEEVEFHNKGN